MIRSPLLRLFESLVLAGLLTLAFRFPAASGHGYLEAVACLLFPVLLFESVFRGRPLPWSGLALVGGVATIFSWVPATIAVKGGLPYATAWLGAILFFAWEAGGMLAVVALTRWTGRRSGPWGAAFTAALGILLWERAGFHIYAWSYGACLGGLPPLSRAAAFLTSSGLAALLWGGGTLAGFWLAQGRPGRAALASSGLLTLLLILGGLWYALPRESQHQLDIVVIQPNFDPGVARPDMEAEMWRRSDAELKALHLPRPETRTLLVWPESSILGINHLESHPRLAQEAQRRGILWLFGTEGGKGGPYLLYNLVRGEGDGRPPFLQAKTEPMPFGERMPGPAWLRTRLDRMLGFVSQEPGTLAPESSFQIHTPQGPLRVHPLICSEALFPARALDGLRIAGADLLTNHTNDGWFEQSAATDLHGAQIRLRAVEAGLPLVRATLTGKSGLFREDGSWTLWGASRTEGAYAFRLQWAPVRTPVRSSWFTGGLALALAGATLLIAWRNGNPS